MPIGMDPCLVFGLGSMLASEILWHMLHHRTMPFRIDYGFRVFGMQRCSVQGTVVSVRSPRRRLHTLARNFKNITVIGVDNGGAE